MGGPAENGLRPGDAITLDITDLNDDGDGVGRAADGRVVFTPGAAPGERVRVRVAGLERRHAVAELLEVLQPVPERVEPACPVAGRCGGCRLQHVAYAGQLAWKTERVRTALERGGVKGARVRPALGMENPFQYRNKAQYPVRRGARGGVVLGFFRRGSHEVVPFDACLIQHPLIPAIAEACRRIAEELAIEPYDEERHAGCLRHVVVRTSFALREAMVVLVTRTPDLPHEREVVKRLRRNFPELVGIAHNVNGERTNVIFGRETRLLWGREHLVERLGRLEFEVSPTSFFQVNPIGAVRLYDTVTQFVGKCARTVWDIYCGTGTIGLYVAAEKGGDVRLQGVDSIPEAIRDAQRNARRNGLVAAHFEVGRAERVVPEWVARGERAGVCLLDPPRSGCAPALLDAVVAAKPERIVYVSCNPVTLARDLAYLSRGGYRAEEVQPVDMFPQTPHIEAVARLERV